MDDKRLTNLILIVIIAVFVGVAIVAKQTRDPVMKTLLEQQTKILSTQESMQRVDDLEKRVDLLEGQWKALQTALKGADMGDPSQARQRPPQEDLDKQYTIDVAHTPVYGKKNAPITIVEFVDFQCPFCARFHPATMEAVNAYPDKVNYMLKNFPLSFHPQATPAAKAAFAAGEQGKYFEMADKLLASHQNLTEDRFKEIAKELGLNVDKFMEDYKSKEAKWNEYIQADLQLGSKVDVRGTPTMYINGKKTNARDAAGFKAEIEKILSGK